jgi:hypothetical protein
MLLPPTVFTLASLSAWVAVALLLLLVATLAVLATATARQRLVVPAIVVIATGTLALVLGFEASPIGLLDGIIPLGLVIIAIVAGGPIAMLVLAAAKRDATPTGEHGGIIVPTIQALPTTGRDTPSTREVLRGGTTIGYLERAVVVAAVLIGRWELVVALIAIKGLGRFRDLDAGAATERFIIGTLVSLLWAGVCATLIVFA